MISATGRQTLDRNAAAGFETLAIHMRMRVEEPGEDGSAAQIDPFRIRAGGPQNISRCPDLHNASMADRDCFGDRRPIVERNDDPIMED